MTGRPDPVFALATRAARIPGWGWLAIGPVSGTGLGISGGPGAGFGLMRDFLRQGLVCLGVSLARDRDRRIAALLFAAWYLRGVLDAVSGHADPIVATSVFLFGILTFVGVVGVARGFSTRRSA